MKIKNIIGDIFLATLLSSTTLFALTNQPSKDIKLIETNSTIDDSIEEGEINRFKFIVKYKSKIEFYTTGSTDTYGTILDENNSIIASDDDNGNYTNFKIKKTLNAGTYYIKVRGYTQWDSGDYTLHYISQELPKDLQGSTIDKAYLINTNSATNALINESGDIDIFSLDINQEGDIDIYTTSSIDTYCYLLNSNGDILEEDDDNAEDANCRIKATVTQGRYYIKVRGFTKWDIGDYTIHNKFDNYGDDYPDTFDSATKIDANKTINGSVNYQDDKDYFTFSLDEPKRVKICGFDSNISVEIFDSNYQKIDKNETMIYSSTKEPLDLNYCDGKNANSIVALHQVLDSGKYYIVATANKEQSYRLDLNKYPIIYVGDTIDDAMPIDENQTYSAAIEVYSDIDIFSFELNELKKVDIKSSGKQLFTLLDSKGKEIATYRDIEYKNGNPHILKTLESGKYYIKFKSMEHLFTYDLSYKTL